jgi:hypothetical protein
MMSGPAPKRSSQRRRRNKTASSTAVTVHGPVEQPPLDLDDPHPLAVAMYESLAKSGQAALMEPSDWEYARWVALVQSQAAARPSAMMLMAVDKMLANLLVTESERRRVRLELERGPVVDPDEQAAVTSLSMSRRP